MALFLIQEAAQGGTDTVRIVAGVLAVACVAIIIMRRKGKKPSGGDEF